MQDAQGDDDASSQQQLEFSSFLKLVEELSPKDEEAATGQDQLVSSSPSRGVFLRLVLERGIPGQAVGYLLSVFGEADAESQPATPMPSPGPLPRRAAALGKQPSSSLPPSPSTPMTSPICFPVSPMPGPSAARRRDSRCAQGRQSRAVIVHDA